VTIERTMATPVIVAESEAAPDPTWSVLAGERRPFINVGTPDQMAEALRLSRRRLHWVHLQQLDLSHARGDRPDRRAVRLVGGGEPVAA
jgi:hypothetical protein